MLGFKTSKKVKLRKTKKELVEKTFQLCIKKTMILQNQNLRRAKKYFVLFFLH